MYLRLLDRLQLSAQQGLPLLLHLHELHLFLDVGLNPELVKVLLRSLLLAQVSQAREALGLQPQFCQFAHAHRVPLRVPLKREHIRQLEEVILLLEGPRHRLLCLLKMPLVLLYALSALIGPSLLERIGSTFGAMAAASARHRFVGLTAFVDFLWRGNFDRILPPDQLLLRRVNEDPRRGVAKMLETPGGQFVAKAVLKTSAPSGVLVPRVKFFDLGVERNKKARLFGHFFWGI